MRTAEEASTDVSRSYATEDTRSIPRDEVMQPNGICLSKNSIPPRMVIGSSGRGRCIDVSLPVGEVAFGRRGDSYGVAGDIARRQSLGYSFGDFNTI